MIFDVVVVGAGVAGLSAAAAARSAGLSCLVIEATERIGGRARTVRIGDAAFDMGASWLHDAEHNPLTDIAREDGVRLHADGERERRVLIDGRAATLDEVRAFGRAWERFEEVASARAVREPDVSLAEAIAPLREDPWTATAETWEASLIAAADSTRLSARDWHRNLLEGSNLVVEGGVGDFVATALGRRAGAVRLGTPARAIDWDRAGGGVRVETPGGAIDARAAIVTVSTGVLASGAIRFSPALPPATAEALAGLPMGLLSKVALRATGDGRLGLPVSGGVQQRVETQGEPALSLMTWPRRADHVIGFVGGAAAWALTEPGALTAFARERLRAMLGEEVDEALAPAVETDWGTDPAYLGAYAYALPGSADARGALGEPLAEGRLIFAGEATRMDGLAGTVGGAWLAGREALDAVRVGLARSRPFTVAAAGR